MRNVDNDKGQTMIEYLLLIFVVIIIGTSIFGQLEDYLINNNNSFMAKYLNSYKAQLFGSSESGSAIKYKRFRLRR